MEILDFKEVVLNYRAVFFDAFGVLKNYKGMIDGTAETIEFLKANNIEFFVLTNDASRSPEELSMVYQNAGITDITEDKIISSGMLAKEHLEYKLRQGTVAYLGTSGSAHYFESAGLQTISIKELDLELDSDRIDALVFMDDEGFDWNSDINKTVNLLRKTNVQAIVANTDKAYPIAKNEVSVAIGGIADLVEDLVGKHFIRFGKPDTRMFVFAYERMLERVPDIARNEILMVGDTLLTDIIGGNKFGIDTALVLSGNTLERNAQHLIETSGIIPNHICHSIKLKY